MLNKYPKISIVTATYNAIDTIENTILSVINQDYPNIEYIIIDGGSTDGTVDIIKKYQNKIAYWISESDKGLYDAMNKGIKMATGKWVTMRNSGDPFAEKDSLSKLFYDPVDDDVDFVCGAAYRITDLGYYIAKSKLIDIKKPKMSIIHPATFVRTSWHKERLFDTKYTICADFNLVYKSTKEGKKIEIRNIPIVIFPQGGVSSLHWDKGFRQGRKVIGKDSFIDNIITEFIIIKRKSFRFIRLCLRKIDFFYKIREKKLVTKLSIMPLPLPVNKFY